MSDISTVVQNLTKIVGVEGRLLATYFETDGSGDETLGIDHGGLVTIGRSTNTYTLTVPKGANMVVLVRFDDASLSHALTVSETDGTIAIAFSGAFNSKRCDVFVIYHDSEVN